MAFEEPLVSVVIAAYNAERFLGAAIDSVLAQTWERLECIVVDDGSTDGTADVIRSRSVDRRVRAVTRENGGVSRARNQGMALAEGELIAFLDADDVWLPGKLTAQLELFRRRPDLGLVFCGYAITDADLRARSVVLPHPRDFDMLRWLLLEGDGMGLAFTGVVPRATVELEGGFDEALSTSADCEFACRIAARHPVDAVREVYSLYRNHGGQMHLNMAAYEQDLRYMLDQRLPGSGLTGLRRRGLANLYARVFWTELLQRRWQPAGRAFKEAVKLRPDRLLAIPLRVLARRVIRRVRLLQWQRHPGVTTGA